MLTVYIENEFHRGEKFREEVFRVAKFVLNSISE